MNFEPIITDLSEYLKKHDFHAKLDRQDLHTFGPVDVLTVIKPGYVGRITVHKNRVFGNITFSIGGDHNIVHNEWELADPNYRKKLIEWLTKTMGGEK